MKDHYEVLGVPVTADAAELKRAWREAQQRWHPDRCAEEQAARRFSEAGDAWRVLSDPATRAQYDAARRAGGKPVQPAAARHPQGVGAHVRAEVDVPARMTWRGGRLQLFVTIDGLPTQVEIWVPINARPGITWLLYGRGGAGLPRGDLLILLRRVEPDPHWRAEGLDLHGRVTVSLAEVYMGAAVVVDGPLSQLRVTLPARELKPLRLRGQSPLGGDLIVELDLVWPRPDVDLARALRQATYAVPRPASFEREGGPGR